MTTINKIIRIGLTKDSGYLWCKISYKDGRLSITGVEGPKSNGNCRGGCGQIVMHEWDFSELCDGWTPELVERFRDVWETYHLNNMQAGTPAQTAYLKANPVPNTGNHFVNSCKALADAGLNPDNGYTYGSTWLRIDVPDDVLAFLIGLPETTCTPAWI